MNTQSVIPIERIEHAIQLIRGQKVMLDRDLAALYGVTTGNLNKAVKRNLDRFPSDFMFQLTAEEAENLRFQIGISSSGYGGHRYLPYAFSEPRIEGHDTAIRSLFEAIRQLMSPAPSAPRPEIGFHVKEDSVLYRIRRRSRHR